MSREELQALIQKYLSGKTTEAEERLIDDFFSMQEKKDADVPESVREEMWASVSDRVGVPSSGSSPEQSTWKTRLLSRTSKVSIALALLLALAFGGIKTFLYGDGAVPAAVAMMTAEAARGQKILITLPDGTQVYLNSGSSITYPEAFRPDGREVALSGEAFFDVTPDALRPFSVRSEGVVTRVLGTSFNVDAFDKRSIKVTVVSGRVQVQAAAAATTAQVVLQPNEQAVYDGDSLVSQQRVDVEKFVAWKNNKLYFDGHSLEEVAIELERWYNVSIVFQNDNIRSCRINGQYKDMKLQSILKSIEYMYRVDFRYLNENTIELYGDGCK